MCAHVDNNEVLDHLISTVAHRLQLHHRPLPPTRSPAILGLLAPFVINEVLGRAAAQLCVAMQLDDTTCYDLL